MDDYNGSSRYAPLGAWTYFGLSVLYALPLIGLIFLLIHTFSDSNINRRSFARSYWCKALFIVILFAAAYGIAVATGNTEAFQQALMQAMNQQAQLS